jgi:hypothetical protein
MPDEGCDETKDERVSEREMSKESGKESNTKMGWVLLIRSPSQKEKGSPQKASVGG